MAPDNTISKSNLKECMREVLQLDGALGVALGDWKTGMCLAFDGIDSPAFPNAQMELAVAGNTEVIRAKMDVARALTFRDKIEDILITLSSQYHLIRLSASIEGLFFYLALERSRSNLGLARIKLVQIEKKLVL